MALIMQLEGKKIIDNHVGGLYLHEAVKDVMITICFKIARETSKRKKEAKRKIIKKYVRKDISG